MTYTLEQVTAIMGRHYRSSLTDAKGNADRALWLFTERVVADMKKDDDRRNLEHDKVAGADVT